MHMFKLLKNKIAYMRKNSRKAVPGFTISELLIVVAIMIILFAVGIPAVISYRNSLTIRTLDDKARTIYTAAQNRLVDMMITGEEAVFTNSDGSMKAAMHSNSGICVINSVDRNEDCVSAIISEKNLEPELSNAEWVVSFDYNSMTVVDVIYYEDRTQSIASYLEGIIGKTSIDAFSDSDRLDKRARNKEWYGYYGGDATGTAAKKDSIESKILNKPYITITNAEILYADFAFVCDKNTNVDNPKFNPKFEIKFTDINDKTASISGVELSSGLKNAEESKDLASLRTEGWYAMRTRGNYNIYVYHYILDDLKSDSDRFSARFVENDNDTGLQPGPIQIDVSIDWNNDGKETAATSAVANTLFADEHSQAPGKKTVSINKNYGKNKENAAIITCGRHLQNMDEASGVANNSEIAYFVLKDDIDFTDKNEKEGICNWLDTYANNGSDSYFNARISSLTYDDVKVPNFKPIENINIRYFESDSTGNTYSTKKIIGLYEEFRGSGGRGGLFASITRSREISHIDLIYPRIYSVSSDGERTYRGSQGGFAGYINAGEDNVNIKNCHLYLDESQVGYRFEDSDRVSSWGEPLSSDSPLMTGKISGGLVGDIEGGNVSILSSSAATVIGSKRNADGTIPTNGNTVGGLIGQIGGSAKVTLQQCYSDSYLMGEKVAGLIGNNLSDTTKLTYCYAAGFGSYSELGAGLILGTGRSDIRWSYNVMYNLYPVTNKSYYATAQNVSGINNSYLYSVYYIAPSLGKDSNNEDIDDSKQGLAIGTFTKAGRTVSNVNDAFYASVDQYFETYDPNKSIKYNFIDGLKTYKYPVLKGMDRHGDWLPEFEEGTLVYYEAYKELNDDGSIKSDTIIYRCNFVEKSDPTKSIKLIDEPNYVVVGDGYGLVYTKKPDGGQTINISVSATVDNAITETEIALKTEDTAFTIGSVTPIEVKGATTTTYYVYPLSKAISNLDITGSTYTNLQYYYRINISNGAGGNRSYFFNPHFADTVEEDPAVELGGKSAIPALAKNVRIRTPRHLYMLSLYYEKYRNAIGNLWVKQERNIDYELYDWTRYLDKKVTAEVDNKTLKYTQANLAAGERIIEQSPIAHFEDRPFIANYDGQYNWITNVSFSSKNSDYVGFIGNNAGFISNVILKATYDKDDASKQRYYVKRMGNIEAGHPVYMGIITGFNGNKGVISNCAIAGYYISGSDGTIHAYENSNLYAGGLVGQNNGAITDCSVDSPTMRLSATYANVYMGGFVGNNTANITNCYALGSMEVADSKGGKVVAAGFAGNNSQTGEIVRSYCATAIITSGETAKKYGFSPIAGKVESCEYLNKGTFSYIKRTYPFDFDKSITTATSKTYRDLVEEASGDKEAENAAKHSYEFRNTQTSSKNYPFRAVVRNEKKELVHYGDWFDDENMGIAGVFYWEHEVGGTNDGYHFTYLGIDNSSLVGSTSLCTAHNDGGVITEYGYGYYELTEGTVARVELSDIDIKGAGSNGSKKYITYEDNIKNKTTNEYYINVDASRELSEQVRKDVVVDGKTTVQRYNFYAFTTRLPEESKSKEYIYLNSNKYNGSMKLVFDQNKYESREFIVSPFFANAIKVPNGISGSTEITAFDGTITNYNKTPGFSNDNKYEIRSATQLQYINYNWDNINKIGSVSGCPDKETNQNYNYLMYTDIDGVHNMTRDEAGHLENKYWSQTHDLDGSNRDNFTPIAGLSTHSGVYKGAEYAADLYAWFGDDYDGRSYKIKNININSNAYAVGLFGVCVGANIENVIMYSDNNSTIQRNTERPATADDISKTEGAYALGGLAGIAYDYNTSGSSGGDLELLASFDFEGVSPGEDIVTPLAIATAPNSYDIDNIGTGNGNAVKLAAGSSQNLSIKNADGGSLLKNCTEVVIEADVRFDRTSSSPDWLFYASKDNHRQQANGSNDVNYLGIFRRDGQLHVEKFENGHTGGNTYNDSPASCRIRVEFTNNTSTLYINGVKQNQTIQEAKNVENIVGNNDDGIVLIGKANWKNTGEYADITIDNLKIWGKRSGSTPTQSTTIKNCAIAGYKIVDNSKNKQTEGEANVGGLIGVSNVNLNGCSSVVDTIINSTHYDTNGVGIHPTSGNYTRVGGLTGANKNEIVNCYTGGSISVGEEALYETFDDNNKAFSKDEVDNLYDYDPESSPPIIIDRRNNTHIFVGGITGSGFTETFRNFDNTNSYVDGRPKLYNCYTYIKLPEMTGNIRAVSVLGSVADRFAFAILDENGRVVRDENGDQVPNIYFYNCYYLKSSAELKYDNLPYYKFKGDFTAFTVAEAEKIQTTKNPNNLMNWQRMMYGDVAFLADYYWEKRNPRSKSSYLCFVGLEHNQMLDKQISVTVNNGPFDSWTHTQDYESFAALLNYPGDYPYVVGNDEEKYRKGNWSFVTIKEGDNFVHGKYSFGSNSALEGKDYPFPTIVTQKDRISGAMKDIFVHYGDWPTDGAYWQTGRPKMDIFGDMQREGDYENKAVKSLYVKLDPKSTSTFPTDYSFTFSNGIATVLSASKDVITTGDHAGFYEVKILAKNTGFTTITLLDNGVATGASCTLEIKCDELKIVSEIKDSNDDYIAVDNLNIEYDQLENIYLYADNKVDASGKPVNAFSNDLITWEVSPVEDEIIKTKATTDKNCWEVKRVASGDSNVNINLTYKYKYGPEDTDVYEINKDFKLTVANTASPAALASPFMLLSDDYPDANEGLAAGRANSNSRIDLDDIEDEQYRAYLEGMRAAGNEEVNEMLGEGLDGH